MFLLQLDLIQIPILNSVLFSIACANDDHVLIESVRISACAGKDVCVCVTYCL